MDLSFSELFIICLVAFLVFGPEDFVRRVHGFGKWLGRLKTQANNFKIMLENEVIEKDNLARLKQQALEDLSLQGSTKNDKDEKNDE
jgi:Tat protein translocase TatB subunit